jgi:hypothetical protein
LNRRWRTAFLGPDEWLGCLVVCRDESIDVLLQLQDQLRRRQAFFAYSTNFLIDVDNGVIVDVERPPRSGRPRSWPQNA